MKFSEKQVSFVVSIFKFFNLFIIVLAILVIPLSILINRFSMSIVLALIPALAFYIGLKYRQPWIIPVMILIGSFGTINFFFSNADTTLGALKKYIGLVMSLFQLYFFSRKEVRKYFRSRGIYLFS